MTMHNVSINIWYDVVGCDGWLDALSRCPSVITEDDDDDYDDYDSHVRVNGLYSSGIGKVVDVQVQDMDATWILHGQYMNVCTMIDVKTSD